MRNSISKFGADEKNNLELPSASDLVDELEQLERYLKAEKININLLERYSNPVETSSHPAKPEQKSSKDTKRKPRHKKRNHRELSR